MCRLAVNKRVRGEEIAPRGLRAPQQFFQRQRPDVANTVRNSPFRIGEPAALVTLAHALAYAQLHRIRPRMSATLAYALAYAFAYKPGPPQKATPTYRSTTFKG